MVEEILELLKGQPEIIEGLELLVLWPDLIGHVKVEWAEVAEDLEDLEDVGSHVNI